MINPIRLVTGTEAPESPPAIPWDELVGQNENLSRQVRQILEIALRGLEQWEKNPNSRTGYVLDSCLSTLERELVPMQRRASITRERTAEFAAPDVQRRKERNGQIRQRKAARQAARLPSGIWEADDDEE